MEVHHYMVCNSSCLPNHISFLAASFSEHSEIVAMLLWNDANTQILNSVGLRPIQESKGDIMNVYADFLAGNLLKSWPRLRSFGFCNRNFLNSWVQSIGIQEKHSTRLKQVLIGRQFEDITEQFLSDLGIPGGPALKIMRARNALFGERSDNHDFDQFSGLMRTTSVSLANHEQNLSQVFNGALAEYNMSTAALESLEKTYTNEITQVNTVMQASLHVISEQLQYFSNTQTALVELQKRIAVCQESAKKLGNDPR